MNNKEIFLKNLTIGSRISYIRRFRGMTQQELGNAIGIKGTKARNIICRYERTGRVPRDGVLKEIAKILQVSFILIQRYDFRDPKDVFYLMIWVEELYPFLRLTKVGSETARNRSQEFLNERYTEWHRMQLKYRKKEISHDDYLSWKFGLED